MSGGGIARRQHRLNAMGGAVMVTILRLGSAVMTMLMVLAICLVIVIKSDSASPSLVAATGFGANAAEPTPLPVPPTPVFGASNIPTIVDTYRENQIRFSRDYVGQPFAAVLPFRSASERWIGSGYRILLSVDSWITVDCIILNQSALNVIANWREGDQVKIEGVIDDVTLGSLQLKNCKLVRLH
jgi:hypothetical protein